ncbi:Uncharacterised protein [Sphingobacterium multivorum]|uniref:hypothetical protein n=1 Tax=Sphingobacterium multivorum TaxID=28454 RepID=UPI000DFB9387|nr:hypothetical protein [Sphingobacterium multivorum]QQT46631.1 hypothetical protein I6J00_08235 [Sphingobacterium multivorum]SUJ89401.1 Uncharacterised protein [Sphingobacterium multivorum]
MENKFDFVNKSIENGKDYVADVGLMNVKVDELLIIITSSRSKFYNYFGGLNAYLLLMITDEWCKMVPFIRSNLKEGLLDTQCIESILSLRQKFISGNRLILMFCKHQPVFTKRLIPLRDEIIHKENEMLTGIMEDYYENKENVDNTFFSEVWNDCHNFSNRTKFSFT